MATSAALRPDEAGIEAAAPGLIVEGISKSYGATQALLDASLTVRAGEVHVLLGENGAGKSTLAKIVAGVVRADGGRILIGGRPVDIPDARTARSLGIAIVFQELSLAPHLSVAENLFLGTENATNPFALLHRRKEAARAAAVLAALKLDLPLDRPVGELTIAGKQMLEIAKALLQAPRILILDEPTSTLTEREKSFLFATIRRLQRDGVGILYVTHHLREVFEIGTRVSAMLDGQVTVTTNVSAELTEAQLLEMLTGRKLSMDVTRNAPKAAGPLLVVENLHTRDGCDGVSFHVGTGEVVAIYGVMGCGREGVGRALVGLGPPARGDIRLAGMQLAARHPAEALARGVGYLPMDRKARGILHNRPIRENLTAANLRAFARSGIIMHRAERRAASHLLDSLLVRFRSMEDPVVSLSGGNQQKVLFGRALAGRPRLLVMEDPMAGIDMGAKLDLYRIIRELADEGMSFLLLSSDIAETIILCDRVYTMYAGRIIDEVTGPCFADEERILAAVLGRMPVAGAASI